MDDLAEFGLTLLNLANLAKLSKFGINLLKHGWALLNLRNPGYTWPKLGLIGKTCLKLINLVKFDKNEQILA